MHWHLWLTGGIVLAMVYALVREVARPDLVLLGSLGLLLIAGVVPPETAFAGFSNSAVLTIAALYVVAAGVQRTDGFAFMDRILFSSSRRMPSILLRLMLPTALISAFVNNTPLVAMLMPRLQSWAERERLPVSKVMMPLSYAAVLGGMMTLIGTSTNLVVAGLMTSMTGQSLGLFDLTWVGLPAALVAILYFAFVGHRALPARAGSASIFDHELRDYHFELRVSRASPLAGSTVEQAGLRALGDAYLTLLVRDEHVVGPVGPDEVLQEGDIMAFTGNAAQIDPLLERPGLERVVHLNGDPRHRLPLFTAVVSGTSFLVGRTLREVNFREHFQGVVLAIQRRNHQITSALGRIPLQSGDLLLIEARPGFDQRWNAGREVFYLVAPCRPERPAPRTRKAPVALLIFAAMVLVSAAGYMPLVTAAFIAALAMIATGCLQLSETHRVVDIPILLMIAAAFGIGRAIEDVGLAALTADAVIGATRSLGPMAVLAAIYLVTNVATELLTNSAAAALVVPIALATATSLGLDPAPFAITVAIAASAGFASPFGYQTNLMVMGAGGYRFADFFRAGLPLNLIVMATALLAIRLLWL